MGRGDSKNGILNLGPAPSSITKYLCEHLTDFLSLTLSFLLFELMGVELVNQQDPFHCQHYFVSLPLIFQMSTFPGIKMAFINAAVLVRTLLASSDRKSSPNWLKEGENIVVYTRQKTQG